MDLGTDDTALEQWRFLDPWLKALSELLPSSICDVKHAARDRAERGFSMAPREWIGIGLKELPVARQRELGRALVLVGQALRVDPRVWQKLQLRVYRHDANFQWQRFRPEDLELRVKVYCRKYGSMRPGWVGYFQPDFTVETTATSDVTLSASAYTEAKRRIHDLDVDERLQDFTIPLSFVVNIWDEEGMRSTVSGFERLLNGGSVSIGPQQTGSEQPSLYRLTHVNVESEFLLGGDRRGRREVGWRSALRGLGRLRDLGVTIASFHDSKGGSCTSFNEWLARDRPLRLYHLIHITPGLTAFQDALGGIADRLEALTLTLDMRVIDSTVVVPVVLDVVARCSSLRYLELREYIREDLGWSALERELHEAEPTGGRSVPPSPVHAFTMSLGSSPSLLRGVVACLPRWLPALRSIALTGENREPNVVDNTCVEAILQSFPLLESLDVACAGLGQCAALLDAYRTRRCRVRTLAIDGSGNDFVPLLNELARADTRLARTLQELRIGEIRHISDDVRVTTAAEAMLENNRVLSYLAITYHWQFPMERSHALVCLGWFHRHCWCKLGHVALGLLSALHIVAAPVGSDVVALILSFLRRQLRLVSVTTPRDWRSDLTLVR